MSEINEISALMKKANDKLISSKLLYDAGQYASSVSASYYIMFITAKALLISKNSRSKSHNGLISEFGLHFVKDDEFSNEIFKYLSRTQSLREEADYDAFDDITESIAHLKINQAEEFIDESKKFIK